MIPITGPIAFILQQITTEEDALSKIREAHKAAYETTVQTLRSGGRAWTVSLQEQPCGVLAAHMQPDGSMEITVLYVLPAYRGLGAAYLLLEQAAAENTVLDIWLSIRNERAQRLVTRFGFGYQGESRSGGEEDVPQVRFVYTPAALKPVCLSVPYMDQREKYPTGCESVSAVMALRYAGLDITVEEWIDQHLPKGAAPHRENGILTGANPWKAFPGDPYSPDGWGCFVPVIRKAAETALAGSGLRLQPLYGLSIASLCRLYLMRHLPVILWTTLDMAEGRFCEPWQMDDGSGAYTWTEPMHCLLMTGFDDTYIYCNDPMRGKDTAYPWEAVRKAYRTMHSQAAVVLPDHVPMTYAHSAGAVLYTVREGEIRYLLVREKLGHTGFPKGHLEAGETVYDAALREIREETGLTAELQTRFRRELLYSLQDGNKWKWVTYFTARYDPAKTPRYTGEVADFTELPYEKAMETLTFQNTRDLLAEADPWIRTQI